MTSPVYVPKPKRPRRRSSLKRQRTALMIAAVVVAVLAVAFAIVHYFTSRTTFRDVDGTKYYVLAVDGVYVMQDADGNERNDWHKIVYNGRELYVTADSFEVLTYEVK